MNKTNKKVITIVTIIIIALLVLLLIGVYTMKASISIQDENEQYGSQYDENINATKKYLPKEKLNLTVCSQIDVVFNYNAADYVNNKKIEFSITGDQANYLSKMLTEYEYTDEDNYYPYGDYQIKLPNGVEFAFDYEDLPLKESIVSRCNINGEKILTTMPKEFQTIIIQMVDNMLEANSKIYNTNGIIIKTGADQITVNDEALLNDIRKECKFIYDVESVEEGEIAYEIIFNKDTTLQMYKSGLGHTAKVINNGTEKYVRMKKSYLDTCIKKIINKKIYNLKDVVSTNTLKIERKGISKEITDTNIINEVINLFANADVDYYTDNEEKYTSTREDVNVNEYNIILTLDNAQIAIWAIPDGILRGTTGEIFSKDKKMYRIFMTEEMIEYIEDLVETNLNE